MKGYLANRTDLKVGTKLLQAGMPFPPSQVTPALLQVGHVREVDADGEEYRRAVVTHGQPPQGPIPASGAWDYTAGGKPSTAPKAPARKGTSRKGKAAPAAARKGKGR